MKSDMRSRQRLARSDTEERRKDVEAARDSIIKGGAVDGVIVEGRLKSTSGVPVMVSPRTSGTFMGSRYVL